MYRLDGGEDIRSSFDFLTSTFGARLPLSPMTLLVADPIDACGPITVRVPTEVDGEHSTGEKIALYVQRGGCRFETKALSVQSAGAELMIVADTQDGALQRVGASAPAVGSIEIPAILVTAAAGKKIEDLSRVRASL